MFGISPKNGVKKHFFRPEKWHGFGRRFYYGLHPMKGTRREFSTFMCVRRCAAFLGGCG